MENRELKGIKSGKPKRIKYFYCKREKVRIYIPNFIINDKILIEMEVKPFLTKRDKRQFWYYPTDPQYRLGFLINFGSEKLEIKHRVYDKAREKYKKISINQRTHQHQPASIKGFTLIELLITISILAILASVGLISIINYKNRQNLISTAQEIVTVLRNAQDRSIAQEEGGRWGVYFSNPAGAGNDFYELFKGSSYVGGTIFAKSNLPSNIQFDIPASGSSSTIIFSPVTGLPNVAATVKISLINSPAASSTITIDINGKIQY